MPPYFTITPLGGLVVAETLTYEFAEGVLLVGMPGWIMRDPWIDMLAMWDRDRVREAQAAFVTGYEADGFGSRDPKHPEVPSIHTRNRDLCHLANLALWICRPNPAQFSVVFHAVDLGSGLVIQSVERVDPLLFLSEFGSDGQLSEDDVKRAARIHHGLVDVPLNSSPWNAIWATWAGLVVNREPIRFALLWMALEALFGSSTEVSFRIAQRISFFLAGNATEARELFVTAKKSYDLRSRISHGAWKEGTGGLPRMVELESLVRRTLRRVFGEPSLRGIFAGKKREDYLNDLVYRWADSASCPPRDEPPTAREGEVG